MKNSKIVGHSDININQGFWHKRQLLNAETTIYSIWKRFEETGRFSALRCDWKEGEPNKPHIFYDSDAAKWIEAAAYILEKQRDDKLEKKADELIDLIAKKQDETGYFNSWFQRFDPDAKFTRRGEHELYCAGHLMEAAVAYYYATKKDKLLKAMCRYADYIEKVFKIERSTKFFTCGHPEIELALYKLYQCTNEKRYLELSRWFIDMRGNNAVDTTYNNWSNAFYAQDQLPLRQQTTAEGHAVRAGYLYSAMADIAYEFQDIAMQKACETIFDDIINKKIYITGGIGSSRRGEAFTVAYDLPNETAYAESCAAISLAMFAARMLKLKPDSKYADIIETILYNGFLASTSLDGKSFFYENPLSIDLKRRNSDTSLVEKEALPSTERVEVFECSCCPPNIARFVASVADYLYTYEHNRLYIHQYMDSSCETVIGSDQKISVKQETNYPLDENVHIALSGVGGISVFVRVPSWCSEYRAAVNGEILTQQTENGYLKIDCESDEVTVDLSFPMECRLVEAAPEVHADTGKVAVLRGPVVYCIEAVDNEDGIQDIVLDSKLEPEYEASSEFYFPVITLNGYKRSFDGNALYRTFSPKLNPQKIKLIPYYCFANRGKSDMQVWTQVQR